MAKPSLTDEELLHTLKMCEGRSRNEAAALLGVNAGTLRARRSIAASRGLMGTAPVLEGFEIAKVTNTPRGDFIQQRPERGPEFEPPPNHQIKGVSALVGGDGRTIQQWIKTKADDDSAVAEEAIRAAFEAYTGKAQHIPAPAAVEDDLATVYIIGDHHLGMYGWKAETGQDYDVEIGKGILLYAAHNLLGSTPPSGTAVILSLGDFFHTDSSTNRTPESGHPLDIDTRRSKVCQAGVEVLIATIELALAKHEKVIVRCLPGNHDPESTPWLSISLGLFFKANPRVEVDLDPGSHWFWQFGKVFLAATHGHMLKMQNLPMAMASWHKDKWGATDYRYGYGGHIHHKQKIADEIGGVICETFQVLAPADAWHASMGFRSGRSMVAVTHHKTRGKILENTCNINPRG